VHGILLTGERGLGKQTFAHLMAAAFLCKTAKSPCLHCPSCKKVLEGNHPDVITYVGEGAKSFHIETVREIRHKAMIMPNEADTKVFILANCESMTWQAQNALLKLLEEPPEHTMLILTANERGALLETVRSRVAEIRLLPLAPVECAQRLGALSPNKTAEECLAAARLCGGNLGKAKAMLAEENGMKATDIARGMVNAAMDNQYTVLLEARALSDDKKLFIEVLHRIASLCRDILASKLGADSCLSGEEAPHSAWTRQHTMQVILSAQKAEQMLLQNVSQPLVVNWLCTKLYS
jgi:DNA polymerase-3 subunit delta'